MGIIWNSLWVSLKFHWDTVMQLCLCMAVFCAITAWLSALQQSCNGLQSLKILTLWTFTENLCLLLVWNKAETLRSLGSHLSLECKILCLRAFSGPECPWVLSGWKQPQITTLRGVVLSPVSIDGYIPQAPLSLDEHIQHC